MSKGPNPFDRPECASDESIVVLNADQKSAALKHLRELSFAAKSVFDWVIDDTLTVEMRYSCLNLIGSHLESAKLQLGAKSDDDVAGEHKANQLRQANIECHRLRDQLAAGVSLEAIGLALSSAKDRVDTWWRSIGFILVDGEFAGYRTSGVLQAKLNVSIDRHGCTFDDQPVSTAARIKASIEHLETRIDIIRPRGDDPRVLDTPRSRIWLAGQITERFPHAKIREWTSDTWSGAGTCLRYVRVDVPIEDTAEPVTAGGPSVDNPVEAAPQASE